MKLIAFDFDATVIDGETLMEIGRLAGKYEQAQREIEQSINEKNSYGTSIRKRVEMFKNVEKGEIERKMGEIPLIPGTEETLETLRGLNYYRILVTGNFSICTSRVQHHFDEIFCNELAFENGKMTGAIKSFPIDSAEKKGKIVESVKKDLNADFSASVGDSSADSYLLKSTDCAIGFLPKKSIWDELQFIVIEKNLTNILKCLPEYYVNNAEMTALEDHHADYGISKLEMMENAGRKAALFVEILNPNKIFCVAGKGNNGGDALACARFLEERNKKVSASIMEEPNKLEARINYETAMGNELFELNVGKIRIEDAGKGDVIVDGIFGIGLEGEARGEALEWINEVNKAKERGAVVVSLDVPSGLHEGVTKTAVCTDYTVCFERVKKIAADKKNGKFVGKIAPVGIFSPLDAE